MTLPISTPSLYQNIQQQKPQQVKPVQTPQASTAESSKSSKESAPPTVLNASISQPIQVQIVPSKKKAKTDWASWAFLGVFAASMTASMWLPWVRNKLGKSSNEMIFDNFQLIKETGVKFSDVLGADEAKKSMMDIMDFIKHPEKYKEQGAIMPKGVLLHGPSGTGKTLLAKALAGEAGVPFLSTSGSAFNEKYVGVGAARVRALFQEAHALAKEKQSPVIIYIDELDAVARKRGGWNAKEDDATLTQFLSSMDGMETSEHPIIFIGSTNLRLKELDPAMLRRLERQVEVALPDLKGRQALFEYYGKKYTL
ncbi:MAG: AAA family ATPase, partial [Vampirovibrionales bacterium]